MEKKTRTNGQVLKSLLISILLLILLSGCTPNSYQSYMNDCKQIYQNDLQFQYEDVCINGSIFGSVHSNGTLKTMSCTKIDYNALKQYCFETYKLRGGD